MRDLIFVFALVSLGVLAGLALVETMIPEREPQYSSELLESANGDFSCYSNGSTYIMEVHLDPANTD